MAILVADKLPASAIEGLRTVDPDIRFDPGLDPADLESALADVDILIVRSTRVSGAAIEKAPKLSLIVRAGAGVNTIDLPAASARGIAVANCPGRNAIAVAELVFGLILAIDRRIPECTDLLRRGQWNKKSLGDARGLFGRRLGVIGTGRIGQAVIERARGFGMSVSAWSRSLTAERAADLGVRRAGDVLEMAGDCDVLTVHVAVSPETRKLVGWEILSAMPESAIFINCARGEVVDQQALVRAMDERGLRAGLDVFDPEPAGGAGDFSDPIKDHPNLTATHHLGASTVQAADATAAEALRVVRTFVETGEVPNCVNLRVETDSEHGIVVRHQDRVGVLAGVLDVLKRDAYNVEEMNNRIFHGGAAASAKIMLDRALDDAVAERIQRECDGVIHLAKIVRR